MSKTGAPSPSTLDGHDLRVAVVAASWHRTVMDGLLAGSLAALADAGVHQPVVVRVPGSFELPVAAAHLARAGYDAVIALGVVIRGGTPHFEYVCAAATDGLGRVALDTGVPIGFGLLTCDTEEQALERAGGSAPLGDAARGGKGREDKGREAAEAAVATVLALRAAPTP